MKRLPPSASALSTIGMVSPSASAVPLTRMTTESTNARNATMCPPRELQSALHVHRTCPQHFHVIALTRRGVLSRSRARRVRSAHRQQLRSPAAVSLWASASEPTHCSRSTRRRREAGLQLAAPALDRSSHVVERLALPGERIRHAHRVPLGPARGDDLLKG